MSERQKKIMNTTEIRNKIKDGLNNSNVYLNLKKEKGKSGFARIKVLQYDLLNNYINTYQSISEAGKLNNIDYRTISKNINGKLKTAGGFIWKKLE